MVEALHCSSEVRLFVSQLMVEKQACLINPRLNKATLISLCRFTSKTAARPIELKLCGNLPVALGIILG